MAMHPKKPEPSTKNNALITEPAWNGPPDARSVKGAGTYPNFKREKTRSGHEITIDDSNGAESITVQHRTGSMIQFMPDGAVQIVSHNGQYNIVFGENRLLVTGAHDLTVRGTASLSVEGDYNTKVMGNMNMAVDGDVTMTAKNFNQTIRGNYDVAAKNMSMKIEGNGMMTTQGNFMMAGYGDMMMGSLGGTVSIGASGIVGIRSVTSEVAIQGQGDVSVKSDGGKVLTEASGTVSMKSGDTMKMESGAGVDVLASGPFNADASTINLNSGMAGGAESAASAGDITETTKASPPVTQAQGAPVPTPAYKFSA